METTVQTHIDNAVECLRQIEAMIAKFEKARSVPGVPLVAIIKDAKSHLKLASDAAFEHDVQSALSPDLFNPFVIHDLDRAWSHYAIDEPHRTMTVKKLMFDRDPTVKRLPAEERMGRTVIVISNS